MCRAWRASAQFHVFHDVTITELDSDAFAALLKGSPHVGHFVRVLRITPSDWGLSVFMENAIQIITSKVTRVESLYLQDVNTAIFDLASESALINNLSSIRELCLKLITFKNLWHLAALVASHPYIENLELDDVGWAPWVSDISSEWESILHASIGSHSRLQNISIQRTSYGFVEWLLSHYVSLPIRAVTVLSLSVEGVAIATRLLHSLGSSLQHLEIGFDAEDLPEPQGCSFLMFKFELTDKIDHCTTQILSGLPSSRLVRDCALSVSSFLPWKNFHCISPIVFPSCLQMRLPAV